MCFQINNPDMRVQILKDFVRQHFPSTQLLDYALDVEKITTSKVRMMRYPLSAAFYQTRYDDPFKMIRSSCVRNLI